MLTTSSAQRGLQAQHVGVDQLARGAAATAAPDSLLRDAAQRTELDALLQQQARDQQLRQEQALQLQQARERQREKWEQEAARQREAHERKPAEWRAKMEHQQQERALEQERLDRKYAEARQQQVLAQQRHALVAQSLAVQSFECEQYSSVMQLQPKVWLEMQLAESNRMLRSTVQQQTALIRRHFLPGIYDGLSFVQQRCAATVVLRSNEEEDFFRSLHTVVLLYLSYQLICCSHISNLPTNTDALLAAFCSAGC
jgi:hypothetical protein